MSEDVVKIKGSKSGLQLVFAEHADFAAIEQDIREKLESGSNFFCRGTIIQTIPGQLAPEEKESLAKLLRQYGVILHTAAEEKPLPSEPVFFAAQPPAAIIMESKPAEAICSCLSGSSFPHCSTVFTSSRLSSILRTSSTVAAVSG